MHFFLEGADPSCICEYNMLRKTPLMVAASNNNVEIIKELVSHGADVNQATFTSPLLLAAKFKCCEALEQLLSYNPDINYVDEGGNSALSTLCTVLVINYSTDEYDYLLQFCRKILISGGDITHLTKVSTISPIMQGTVFVRMCPDLIRLLLEFATCREHIQFLSTICEMCTEEGLEDWEQLYDLIWQPRKLTHLCRIKIRCVLGEKGLERIEELPLPATLKGYLRHSEGITFEWS
ncbi:ankyrin [Paramuricea clavata]|uniref:Ankyrin, partial n=1 Tax=Paramuricea clavata TaxID=317549 RepID=A0A6S7KND9_PARCT|nr:ankyrin [Paramuricea clavata]